MVSDSPEILWRIQLLVSTKQGQGNGCRLLAAERSAMHPLPWQLTIQVSFFLLDSSLDLHLGQSGECLGG